MPDNFTPLTSLDWQVHVYGDATREIQTACEERELPLHVFPWRPEMGRAGLRRNAVYLVRPDGYVALADAERERRGDHVLSRRAQAHDRDKAPRPIMSLVDRGSSPVRLACSALHQQRPGRCGPASATGRGGSHSKRSHHSRHE